MDWMIIEATFQSQ